MTQFSEPASFTQEPGLNSYEEQIMLKLGALQEQHHRMGKVLLELQRACDRLEEQKYEVSQEIQRLTDDLHRGRPAKERDHD